MATDKEKAQAAAKVVGNTDQKETQEVARLATGGKDTGGRKVRVTGNRSGVNFPDGEGGLVRYAAGKDHTVPAALADATDPEGNRYFEDVKDD